jgi:pilus assembly protein CpaE
MLRSIIICPDRELGAKLDQALQASGAVSVLRNTDKYPAKADLVRILRANAAEVLFLGFEQLDKALEVVQTIEQESNHVQIVAIHRTMDSQILRESMRAGVREFLVDPFEREALWESLRHVKDLLDRHPAQYEATNQIFTFCPSKAGAGASTIALNVAAAMGRQQGMRVLLSDFDLNSGMMRFLLKLDNPHSVPEACERCEELDDNLWPQLVTNVNGLDVLHAGRINPNLRIEAIQVRTLIAFMRRNYQSLCFDVSGNLERYSLELMQESKRIMLVCTPEIPSLHQAREKMMFLKTHELDGRVSVILNRVSKKPLMTIKQVAEIVGAPVVRSFPNDYNGVAQALSAGTLVATGSELGKAYIEFAESLITGETRTTPKAPPTSKRKFLDFLTVTSQASLTQDN